MSAQPTCDTCRFWELIEAHDMYTSGSCNKYAPRPINQMVEILDVFEVRWPVTGSDDWCGEHTPKEKVCPTTKD